MIRSLPFPDIPDQFTAAAAQAGQVKLIFAGKIMVEQAFVNSRFTDIIYRPSRVTVLAEFLHGGFDDF